MRTVDAGAWREEWAAARAAGAHYFDFLTAVDRGDRLEVVAHAVDLGTMDRVLLGTSVPTRGGRLDSISPLFAGAAWHEREAAEMFGITFAGHPDPRPLLLRASEGAPPLLKATVLAARVVVAWPGAAEPEVRDDGRRTGNPSRRRQRPPGAPDDWLEEGP
ncbi:MAG: NADH-quinone oxidoreductase subunit [Actinomycetota bacterium]|nr:NADH-quinone oxidoreductase subunit [Actinomycetota bacterium]